MNPNPNHDAIQAVVQSEQALAQAHLDLDIAAFDHLLHPRYVIIQPGGKIEGKQETIDSLQSGDRHWDIAQIDDLVVQVYGDTAIVTGRWRGKGQNGAVAFDYSARILSVWIKEGDLWRNVAAQSTDIEN